ncbi:hypothetical protein SMETP3_22930 [Serratia marcescens]|uniref:T6SS effector amidase Tae4 family protein n=1 Tax=Serratia TaxID=613 RepID=UPI00101F6EDC|nr:T6SS effector amidase Tae4 family protein [Serratia marcescens]MBH2562968.1 hypothetical protein [Serratia marcescens]QKO39710.1 hypothetical protein F0335_14760 [Serratia marcescens]RZA60296.1 hypothetical protein EVY46_01195 [Serratia marcescens]BEN11805.1 hypothetical protein SMETP3_22930 [Serratia marcescens]
MKPLYRQLKSSHYSSDYSSPGYLAAEAVYAEIGYELDTLLKQNPGYANTCAVRMSLALLKAGISFKGRLPIKKGAYKGKAIEPGAKLLADQLHRSSSFGKANIFFNAPDAEKGIGNKKGVVFFNKITNYDGGHIDLIEPENSLLTCHSHCYFNCKEVWFWELS